MLIVYSDAPAPIAALETTDNGESFDTKNFVKMKLKRLKTDLEFAEIKRVETDIDRGQKSLDF